MKIKPVKKSPLLAAVLIAGTASVVHLTSKNSAKAAQRITVESEASVQVNANPASKIVEIDQIYHYAEYKFKIPDSAVAGDFFEVETSGVPEFSKNQGFVDKNGKAVAVITEKTCKENTYTIQLTNPSDNIFNALKTEDGPGKCKYKITLTSEVDNSNNVSFEIKYNNIPSGGFPIASKDYNYNAFIKVNDELKWSDTYVVPKRNKVIISDDFIWHFRTVIDTDSGVGLSRFGLRAVQNMAGKTLEIGVDADSPIVFVEDRTNLALGSNFLYTNASKTNSEGVINHVYKDFRWNINYSDKQPLTASLTVTSQTDNISFSSGFNIKSKLNLQALAKMNLKEGDAIPVVYNAKIKNADGSILWEGKLTAQVIFSGSKTVADLIRDLSKPDPAQPADNGKTESTQPPAEKPKEEIRAKIVAPNTGFDISSLGFVFFCGIAALATLIFAALRFGKISKVKF